MSNLIGSEVESDTISTDSIDSEEEFYNVNNNEEYENEDNNNDDNDANNDDDDEDSDVNEDDSDVNEGNDNEDIEQRPKTSNVWNFVDKETRKCSCCAKIFNKKTGTSSIRTHLKKHGFLLEKQEQTTLDSFVNKQPSQSEKKYAILEWIVLDMQPFKVVEGEAFRRMILKFDSKHQLPSRNTIKNYVIKLFNKQRENVKNYIKNIPGKISLTTDIWTSLKNEGFLGITIHFINEEWVLKHFTLDIFKFKGSHTGQAIADEIYRVLSEFSLENKIIAMTTDNASNMISCARNLSVKFEHNSTFIHYRCVAHILNLIVTAGLDVIKEPIKKLRKLVKVIRKSAKMLEELERLSDKNFLTPIIDCKTRWNSTYKMINRVCILKENIQMLAVKYPNLNDYLPTQTEWELFHDLDQFLETFNKATIDLSTQSYPTIAHSRVILLAIKVDLYVDRGEESLLNELIIPMKEKLENYYETLKEPTHIAAFLDPRYKNYCFPEMSNDEILLPIQQKLEQAHPTTSISSVKTSPFLQKLKSARNVQVVINDEASKYWNSTEAAENIKPLEWWKTHSTEYPNLSKLAIDYLCIQASSVPCEQLFSVAGQILCKSRNRLTGESVRACMCLHSWLSEIFN